MKEEEKQELNIAVQVSVQEENTPLSLSLFFLHLLSVKLASTFPRLSFDASPSVRETGTEAAGRLTDGCSRGWKVAKVQLLRLQPVGSDVHTRARAEATSAATWSRRAAPLDGQASA